MPDDHLGSGLRGARRSRRPLHVPKASSSPIPPYPGDVIAIQNDAVPSVEEQSVVVGGQNNPIRVVYGRQVIGADVAAVLKNGADLVILCVWCEGECDAIERFWINGNDPPAYFTPGTYYNHYLGATGQGIDPLIKYAAAASGLPTYTDTLPGICYSTFEIPPGICTGFPEITVLLRGRKVSTTSGGAKTYSENPAYCLADLIENASFGLGRAVDWASVATVAARCDEMIGSPAEKRNVFSLILSDQQPAENWLATIADYAGCWVIPEGASYRLVADTTGTVVDTRNISGISKANPMRVTTSVAHGFPANAVIKIAGINAGMTQANGVFAVLRAVDATHFDMAGIDSTAFSTWTAGGTATQIGVSAYSFNASNIVAGTFNAQYKSQMETPTVVEVDYTDTTQFPWRTATIDPVYVPGVYDIVPTVPFRRTRVSKPGLTRYSEAHRYAVQLLNGGQLNDLTASFQARDVTLTLQVGDLIDVTHPSGLSSKIMRLVRAEPVSPGRWDIVATEHDDAKYSTIVVTGPSTLDGPLASPLSPPTVALDDPVELVVLNASGAYVSQLSITWTDASPPAGTYPFVLNYRVDILNGATLVETATVQRSTDAAIKPKYVTGPLPENILYTVRVTTISDLLAESAPAVKTITNSGKSAPPSDVKAILEAFEVGGEVRILIDPATDLDLTAHEYRYGDPATSSWATAFLLDRVATPSVRYTTRAIPPGTWRIYVKGLDSVRTPAHPWGQESVNAVYVDIEVSSDAGAFVAVDYDYATANLYKMSALPDGWISDSGATWNATLTSAINTYATPLLQQFIPAKSALLTEVADHGASITADWFGTVYKSDLSGTSSAFLDLSNGGGEATKVVNGATNATPIVIQTSAAHGYSTGDEVVIAGVAGNTAANGRWVITVTDTTHFSLQDFAGNNVAGSGAFSGNGTASRWAWFSYSALTAKTTARWSRLRIVSTGMMKVTALGNIRANVVARHEGGMVTAAGNRAVVSFVSTYITAVAASATPVFDGATTPDGSRCVVDMIETSGGRGINALYLLRFNGTSDYVSVGDFATYEFGGAADTAFSVEFWLKPATIGAAQCIVSKGSAINITGSYEVRLGAAGKIQFILIDSNAPTAYVNCATTTLLVPGLWYHVACTYSGSGAATPGNMKVYLNGALETTSLILNGTYIRMRDTAIPLEFGRHNAGDSWLNGRLDEVRIWSRALSASEIVTNMYSAPPAVTTGMVGRWGFDEDPLSGATTTDGGTGLHDGTLVGCKRRPYNGMDIYQFDTTGAGAPVKAAWSFDGV